MKISAARRTHRALLRDGVAKAAELARSKGLAERPMIFLNIGEPRLHRRRWGAGVAERAFHDGGTSTPQATGCPLRERISQWYAALRPDDPARRIVVTAGPRRRCSWPAWR